jgi:toxin FitB
MIVLDSNVLSELMRPSPEPRVIAWLDRQPPAWIWTTSVTVFEIRFGLHLMPAGKRRTLYSEGFEKLLQGLDHRIASFDTEAAEHTSALLATRKLQGRPRELRDTMIAGIVLSRRFILATRNIAHFQDVSAALVDPWSAVA